MQQRLSEIKTTTYQNGIRRYSLSAKRVGRLFQQYFKKLGISKEAFWKQMDVQQIRRVFLFALQGFLQKRLSVDELSSIGTNLYYNMPVWGPFEIDGSDVELGNALDHAGELFYYSIQYEDPRLKKSYDDAAQFLQEYFRRNKALLNEL